MAQRLQYERQAPVLQTDIVAQPMPEAQVQAARDFAVQMSNLNEQINRSMDAHVIDAAGNAGVKAGLQPDFKPADDSTLAGQAYNKMGIQTHLSQLEIQARRQIDQYYQQNLENPDGLEKAVNAYANGLRETLNRDMPEAVPQFNDIIDRTSWPYLRAARTAHRQLLQQQGAATAMTNIDSILSNAEQIASDPHFDDASAADLALERQKLVDTLAQQGPPGEFSIDDHVYKADPTRTGLMGPDDIQKQLMAFDYNMQIRRTVGAFDKILNEKGTTAATVAFEAFRRSDNKAVKPDVKEKAMTEMLTSLSRANHYNELMDATAKANLKAEQDATAKEGITLGAHGKLTWGWLDKNKDNLSVSDFNLLSKQVGGKFAQQDNLDAVLAIEDNMRGGNDAYEQIKQAALHNQLTESTMRTLINRNATLQKTDGPSLEYKRVTNWIKSQLAPNPYTAKFESVKAKQGEVLRRFDEWYQSAVNGNQGHAPGYEDQLKYAQNLVGQYLNKADLMMQFRATTPMPSAQFRVEVPNSGGDLDINATMAKINEHYGVTKDTLTDKIPQDYITEIMALKEYQESRTEMQQLEQNSGGQ